MTHSRTPREASRVLSGPWGQAALVGALTLVPARSYPRWLRRTLIWGPPVAGTIGWGYVAARGTVPQVDEERPLSRNPAVRTLLFATSGAAVGAVCAGVLEAGFWVDEKAERGLRKLKVPLPRLVMGCAAGALTWWQVTHEDQLEAQ